MFICFDLADSRAHWGSLGSFGLVWFIWVRPGCRWVHSGLFGSFGCALWVVVFIRVRRGGRWVH